MESDEEASNYEEIFMQPSLKFAESLKGLKNLRGQLYSAAEYFETSYAKKSGDDRPFVVDSSKDYITKSLVSTVDHLGSVTDKLNKFLDQKVNDFSATKIRFSCIEQRLNMFQGFGNSMGLSQNSMMTIKAAKHHKLYIIPDDSAAKSFHETVDKKPQSPLARNGYLRIPSGPPSFSFTRFVSTNEAGNKRSISPLRFALKRSGSVSNQSAPSANLSDNNKHLFRIRSEPKRAISVSRRPEIQNKDREIELYSKRSKHLFRALLNVYSSRK